MRHSADVLFQYDSMKRYIDSGGSILLTLNEGGEGRQSTNINIFLKLYGIQVNDGSVPIFLSVLSGFTSLQIVSFERPTTSTSTRKKLWSSMGFSTERWPRMLIKSHPMPLLARIRKIRMQWSSTNPSVLKLHGKTSFPCDGIRLSANSSLEFVYPFGASLTVQPPAVPVLSTGSTCLPCQKSVCAFYTSPAKVRTVCYGNRRSFFFVPRR